MSFGRIIFGDNQFLGINHASQNRAAEFRDRFATADAIIEVLGWAYEQGVRDFMFTTHERLEEALREITRSHLFPEMKYIPCLPYAHKYANALSEGRLVTDMRANIGAIPKIALLGSLARAATGDLGGLVQILVEIELLMTRGLNVSGVFLQNVFVDLALGLHGKQLLERFHRYVEDRIGATPGYITMNHPLAQKVLCDEIGVNLPWICANFNVAGYRMHPGQSAVESSFANGRSRNIAMSVFASGALNPEQSLKYLCKSDGLDSVLFGSSRRENIILNVKMLSTMV